MNATRTAPSATSARPVEISPALEVLRPRRVLAVPPGGTMDEPVVEAIFEAIVNQRLAPGTKLPEAELCELFSVSRTVVRQALRRLAEGHVVDIRPNRGASVAAPTPEETREIFEARRGVEAAILPLAARAAGRADYARLRERLRAEQDALAEGNHARWVKLAGDFHLALADLAGNRVLRGFLEQLMSRCSLIVALYERDEPAHATCQHDEHDRIVHLMEIGDVAGAVAEMDAHLRELEAQVRVPATLPASDGG
ncbi:GntR family transcriptional regulator [Derxia gummosa]|uniref:GntR family transcriptional regulator n=1 Tax=Derxia gummosa DSM 723 TaxID=1121388 RepID=A0A8B6XBK8_9BURK|nr:GntR family transcriptional regulator [Derxia gummosa]